MRYVITLHNEFKQPYFYGDAKDKTKICKNVDHRSCETSDRELCKTIVKDFLDVPVAEMTLSEIREQFESPNYGKLSEEKLVAIQKYYNGRLGIYNSVISEFNSLLDSEERDIKYEIPYEYNHFVVYDDNSDWFESQICAYIEVEVKRDE